jgi:hypothetical protein
MPPRTLIAALALLAGFQTDLAQAESPSPSAEPAVPQAAEDFAVHGQNTYIWQRKPAFRSPYEGANSLTGARAKSYSNSLSFDLGFRPWQGAELHVNPEVIQGVPFSDLHGMGGLSNGELAKVTSANPTAYLARVFVRQTWNLDGETETQEAGFNQLAGPVSARRVVLTAGKFSALDVFDASLYGHDPRTQFMNGAFMTHGSFDYPADARGYTWGAALEYITPSWSARIGRMAQPVQSNGQPIDLGLLHHYGDVLEVEKRYALGADRPGKLSLLLWRNRARMGAFDDALAWGAQTGHTPDVAAVSRNQAKVGVGVSVAQALNDSVGVFVSAGASDDKTETYAFTEIGRNFSAGVLVKGNAWSRPKDVLGIALAVNGLSRSHANYLAAGGLGGFLGDGQLNYGAERITEMFYALQLNRYLSLSADFQFTQNPGYNRARGPARFYGVRLHAEF